MKEIDTMTPGFDLGVGARTLEIMHDVASCLFVRDERRIG